MPAEAGCICGDGPMTLSCPIHSPGQIKQRAPEPEKPVTALAHTPMELLSLAANSRADVGVMERLMALYERQRDYDAETQFNQELAACQNEVQLIVNDSDKAGPGGKKWATYKALDRAIRPIYLRHGFSISFGSGDCSIPDQILVICHVSRQGHTRMYQLPMDASGKGPQGSGALSKPHAILAAAEYGRRCLLKLIFNLVTGEEDVITNGELQDQVEYIQCAKDPEELGKLYAAAYEKFEATPAALKVIIAARKARKKEQGW